MQSHIYVRHVQSAGKLCADACWWVAGTIAHCGGPDPARRCPFVRLSFATASVEELPTGISRLADVLRKVSQKQSHVQEEADTAITTATTMY